jgi:hypothetical protein
MPETNFDQNQKPGAISPNENLVRNWLAGIAIVLVILIAITYILHRNDTAPTIAGDDMSSATATTTATSTAVSTTGTTGSVVAGFAPLSGTVTTTSNGEAIAVDSQPAGAPVVISSMTLFRKSWVAVEAMDGSILGAGLFSADATSGTIPLLRDTVAGKQYEVVIYAAATGKSFDFLQDQMVVGSDGSPIGAAFTAL